MAIGRGCPDSQLTILPKDVISRSLSYLATTLARLVHLTLITYDWLDILIPITLTEAYALIIGDAQLDVVPCRKPFRWSHGKSLLISEYGVHQVILLRIPCSVRIKELR